MDEISGLGCRTEGILETVALDMRPAVPGTADLVGLSSGCASLGVERSEWRGFVCPHAASGALAQGQAVLAPGRTAAALPGGREPRLQRCWLRPKGQAAGAAAERQPASRERFLAGAERAPAQPVRGGRRCCHPRRAQEGDPESRGLCPGM